MKSKIKMLINVGMVILVLLQMAYHLTGSLPHMWIGIILFILLILHNILNRKWYLGIFRGRYNLVRFFHTFINILLLASYLCVAVSAIFLSPALLVFFHLKAAMLGRRIHMVFTMWSFVLMSAHVGLHWNRGINALKKQSKRIQCLFWIVVMLLSGYGVHVFLSRELLQRMLFLTRYVFFDYEESIILLIIDYFSILCMFSCFTYGVSKLIAKQKKKSILQTNK